MMSTIEGMIITFEGEKIEVQARTGEFTGDKAQKRVNEINHICKKVILHNNPLKGLRKDSLVLPLELNQSPIGFVYLENTFVLSHDDLNMIQIMTNQCAGALENLKLHIELGESYEHVIETLALVAEYKDLTTGEHINRIAHYTQLVAEEMGIPEEQAKSFGKASRLHDVGKVGIPDAILKKKGKLTPEEFEIIKQHTEIGSIILAKDKSLELSSMIALTHHEQWDGSGYLNGLSGEEIPLVTRIVSVVDVYDALVHRRPYKEQWKTEDALVYLEEVKGKQFYPDAVDAFARVFHKGKLNSEGFHKQNMEDEL